MLQKREQEVVDGLMLAGASVNTTSLTLFTTDKYSAERLYGELKNIVTERNLQTIDERYIPREHYLDLDESPRHQISDEDAFDWNHNAVWELTVTPSGDMYQFLYRWFNGGDVPTIPDDFELSPVTSKILYETQAFEMPGGDAPYIELETRNYNALGGYLEKLGLDYDRVGGKFRLDEESSHIFREHAGVKNPRPVVTTDGGE